MLSAVGVCTEHYGRIEEGHFNQNEAGGRLPRGVTKAEGEKNWIGKKDKLEDSIHLFWLLLFPLGSAET